MKGRGSPELNKCVTSYFITFDMGWVRIGGELWAQKYMLFVWKSLTPPRNYLIDFINAFFLLSVVSQCVIRVRKVTAYVIKILASTPGPGLGNA